MSKFKDSVLGAVIILASVCFVVVLSLSFVNKITEPIIEANSSSLTLEEKVILLPNADNFENYNFEEDFEGILKIEKATNNVGYLFEVVVTGYHGEFKTMVAINSDGTYSGMNVFEHEETPGVGTKAFTEERFALYYGTNSSEIDTIAGVTVTSKALNEALAFAMSAFEGMDK